MRFRLIKVPIGKATEDESFHMHRMGFQSGSGFKFWVHCINTYARNNPEEYSVLEITQHSIKMISLRQWLSENEQFRS